MLLMKQISLTWENCDWERICNNHGCTYQARFRLQKPKFAKFGWVQHGNLRFSEYVSILTNLIEWIRNKYSVEEGGTESKSLFPLYLLSQLSFTYSLKLFLHPHLSSSPYAQRFLLSPPTFPPIFYISHFLRAISPSSLFCSSPLSAHSQKLQSDYSPCHWLQFLELTKSIVVGLGREQQNIVWCIERTLTQKRCLNYI